MVIFEGIKNGISDLIESLRLKNCVPDCGSSRKHVSRRKVTVEGWGEGGRDCKITTKEYGAPGLL